MSDLLKWEQDKHLYVFTSLTAGSSHIVTATNRIDTILRNARIPFTYIDTATNDSAKALFQRRGRGKKLPFLVKEGFVIGDLEQVEEWNEFGELKEAIGPVEAKDTSITTTPAKAPATGSSTASAPAPVAGAIPTPTLTKAESSSGPAAPTPGATPLPPSTMSAMQAAALETAALAKARQAGASAPTVAPILPAVELKAPAPTPVQGVEAIAEPPEKLVEKAKELEETKAFTTSPLSATGSNSSLTPSHTGHISPIPFVPEHFEPPPTMHRGSSVSLVSEEEIKEVERRETIQEEDEEEDEEDEKKNDVGEVTKAIEAVKLDSPESKKEEAMTEDKDKEEVKDAKEEKKVEDAV